MARICRGDTLCDGRQANGLNPMFIGPPQPARLPGDDPRTKDQGPRLITINDLARFLPATTALHAEPDGWAVIGVPANFWAYVRPLTVEGELLGEQAAVRFAPRLYEWNYGDGTLKVTQTGGSSWAGVGQEELTETSTSHVYTEKRAAQASVTVYWSAEYRFAGSDWIPVEGAVSNRSPEQRMLVVKERTVLTAQ